MLMNTGTEGRAARSAVKGPGENTVLYSTCYNIFSIATRYEIPLFRSVSASIVNANNVILDFLVYVRGTCMCII